MNILCRIFGHKRRDLFIKEIVGAEERNITITYCKRCGEIVSINIDQNMIEAYFITPTGPNSVNMERIKSPFETDVMFHCVVCGKPVNPLNLGQYCSQECFLKHQGGR